ncbi:MAG: hypothetical protein H7296_08790 [Bacteroidia bacterium]|nr:hypothetical protein [Bacteroidia bacterium]
MSANSKEVNDLVEAGTYFSVNDALMETIYKDGMHRELKSYRQWVKAGFQIRTGEKPFYFLIAYVAVNINYKNQEHKILWRNSDQHKKGLVIN